MGRKDDGLYLFCGCLVVTKFLSIKLKLVSILNNCSPCGQITSLLTDLIELHCSQYQYVNRSQA